MKAGDKITHEGVEYEAFEDQAGGLGDCALCELDDACSTTGKSFCRMNPVHFVRPDEALKRRLKGEPV